MRQLITRRGIVRSAAAMSLLAAPSLILPSRAQSPIAGFPPGVFQSRAALDASGGGGAPIVLQTASPNDMTAGSWTSTNQTPTFPAVGADPIGGFNASLLTSTANSGNVQINATVTPSGGSAGVLLAGQHYTFRGFLEKQVGATWFGAFINAGGLSAFQWFDVGGAGTVGTPGADAGCFLDIFTLTNVGTDWFRFDMEVHFTAGQTGAKVFGFFGQADATFGGTIGQAFETYGWGA